jgi:hypothetical protein
MNHCFRLDNVSKNIESKDIFEEFYYNQINIMLFPRYKKRYEKF